MSAQRRVTNEQIVEAYQRTGSVWKAARELGIVGQSVWERLRALGVKLSSSTWTDEEITELRVLAGTVTVGEIAARLGRPYAGVACKLSELGVSGAAPRTKKVPRGVGLNKVTVHRMMADLEFTGTAVSKFCRSRCINIDAFVLAAQTYEPERWKAYVARTSALAERVCEYCTVTFVPTNTKQRTCSRKCQRDARVDRDYFGGQRKNTVGLAEGVCQLCGKKPKRGLSSHHVLGKENDPDNAYLIALCTGCHNVVGLLGRSNYITTAQGWENLISLATMRRLADQSTERVGVHVAVDIEWLTREDLDLDDEEQVAS